jgi:hypothetical protein
MNDAEHDAWLREALRHAPDAEALPPRSVSEEILATARAAAGKGRASGSPRRATGAASDAFAALWAWLARPPVAAGFASVMAATLIGLMWWDRPMEDALPPRPESAVRQAPARATATAPAAAAEESGAVAPPEEREPAKRQEKAAPAAKSAQARGAATGRSPSAQREAPARSAATPFPASVESPTAGTAEPTLPAKSQSADEKRESAAADSSPSAPASPTAQRRATLGESRDQQAGASASRPTLAAAPARNEIGAFERERAGVAGPLAPLLASIASAPEAWSRAGPDGRDVPIEPAWRDWLAQLDRAASGGWRALAAGAALPAQRERGEATVLRLVAPGRPSLTVRLAGQTARIEDSANGERWQATLPADAAARLRAAAERLPR